jgi:hypothetical protein
MFLLRGKSREHVSYFSTSEIESPEEERNKKIKYHTPPPPPPPFQLPSCGCEPEPPIVAYTVRILPEVLIPTIQPV